LHLLARQPDLRARGLRAIHVDHGLNPDSGAWALHCGRICAGLGLALEVRPARVPHDSGLGLEAAAREARYAEFAAALRTGECLALAQHRDDQAETFLLRSLRASGVDGLAAMRPLRRFASGWLWRPLLDVPRADLLAHARASGLAWIEDPANAEPRHDRNFLRHRLLPLLRDRWPDADRSLARSAALCAESADLLAAEDARALALAATADPRVLRIEALNAATRALRARLLRRWLSGLALPPPPGRLLAELEGQLSGQRDDAGIELRWPDARLRLWRGLLWAGPGASRALPPGWRVEWDATLPCGLPGGDHLVFESTDAPGAKIEAQAWHLSARFGGERIRLPGRAHRHSLKKRLQALGVPPWEREALPLLHADDGELLAAGDLLVSARLAHWCRSNGLRLRWRRTD
jgi:tRNA(Ile)-lysidine synthase